MAKCCGFGNSYSFITPNVPPTPITAGDTSFENLQISGAYTIPKGAIHVSIKNIGLASGTVQGNPYDSGQADYVMQAFHDPMANKVYYLPEIVLDASNTQFQVQIYRPI